MHLTIGIRGCEVRLFSDLPPRSEVWTAFQTRDLAVERAADMMARYQGQVTRLRELLDEARKR